MEEEATLGRDEDVGIIGEVFCFVYCNWGEPRKAWVLTNLILVMTSLSLSAVFYSKSQSQSFVFFLLIASAREGLDFFFFPFTTMSSDSSAGGWWLRSLMVWVSFKKVEGRTERRSTSKDTVRIMWGTLRSRL